MVTDFLDAIFSSTDLGSCLVVFVGNVLVDGRPVRSISLGGSIILFLVGVVNCWGY